MDGAHQVELGYKFRGTTDVAVVDKMAYRAGEYKVYELSSLCKPVSVHLFLLCAESLVACIPHKCCRMAFACCLSLRRSQTLQL